eukprot:2911604-Pleurochrysis_carterae.AAC.1
MQFSAYGVSSIHSAASVLSLIAPLPSPCITGKLPELCVRVFLLPASQSKPQTPRPQTQPQQQQEQLPQSSSLPLLASEPDVGFAEVDESEKAEVHTAERQAAVPIDGESSTQPATAPHGNTAGLADDSGEQTRVHDDANGSKDEYEDEFEDDFEDDFEEETGDKPQEEEEPKVVGSVVGAPTNGAGTEGSSDGGGGGAGDADGSAAGGDANGSASCVDGERDCGGAAVSDGAGGAGASVGDCGGGSSGVVLGGQGEGERTAEGGENVTPQISDATGGKGR